MANKEGVLFSVVMGLLLAVLLGVYVFQGKPEVEEVKVREFVDRPVAVPATSAWYTYATVTAYCTCEICCGEFSDGKTAVGKDANEKGVAVDPAAIPYGSLVVILTSTGPIELEADDTGGAMRESWQSRREVHLDIRMPDHQQALDWGVQLHPVIIYPIE